MMRAHVQVGTFSWAAPEVLLGKPCTEKVDIYSYGVLLWELSAGEAPPGRNLRPLRFAPTPLRPTPVERLVAVAQVHHCVTHMTLSGASMKVSKLCIRHTSLFKWVLHG